LLQEELYTTLIDLDFDLDEVIFQQDNAFIHKAKIVQDWFWKQRIGLLNHQTSIPLNMCGLFSNGV
jgi:hypothetical protein